MKGYEAVLGNHLYVPTDDDDWFHPDLIDVLKQHRNHTVLWDYILYAGGVVRRWRDPHYHLSRFQTNNFAVMLQRPWCPGRSW